MDTPFFYPAEGEEAVAYHKTAAALSPFSKTGLTISRILRRSSGSSSAMAGGSPARPS